MSVEDVEKRLTSREVFEWTVFFKMKLEQIENPNPAAKLLNELKNGK